MPDEVSVEGGEHAFEVEGDGWVVKLEVRGEPRVGFDGEDVGDYDVDDGDVYLYTYTCVECIYIYISEI